MPDLKRELKARDLPVSGNKSELVERLVEAAKAEAGKDKRIYFYRCTLVTYLYSN